MTPLGGMDTLSSALEYGPARLLAKKKDSSKVPENMETAQFHQIGLLHKEVK